MDVAREPGRGIGRIISTGEHVETELDNFIERRHNRSVAKEGERDEEEAWKEAERRYTAARRELNRLEWIQHYEGQADRIEAALGALVKGCRDKAGRLRGEEGA